MEMSFTFTTQRSIYVQLADEIKQRIVLGIYNAEEKLPSVRDFAKEFSVNPNTMQKALTELEARGIIYTERTNGKFVCARKDMSQELRQELAKDIIKDYIDQMTKLGFSITEAEEFISNYGREKNGAFNV